MVVSCDKVIVTGDELPVRAATQSRIHRGKRHCSNTIVNLLHRPGAGRFCCDDSSGGP